MNRRKPRDGEEQKPLLVFLAGPTSSGKSEIAAELALLINGEVISADSMQIYRHVRVMSAVPPEMTLAKVPHHLIEDLEPDAEYNAAAFRETALRVISEIQGRGRIPVIAGGTGLYIKTLIEGIFQDAGKNEQLRKDLERQAKEKGCEVLYYRLKKLDPAAANRININDQRRIIRALESLQMNPVLFSELKNQRVSLREQYDIRMFGLQLARELLYRRIEERVDKMFTAGLIEEIRQLGRYNPARTVCQALGYRQVSSLLEGKINSLQCRYILKRDTRRYAKRQLTWFRNQEKEMMWIDADKLSPAQLAARIKTYLPL